MNTQEINNKISVKEMRYKQLNLVIKLASALRLSFKKSCFVYKVTKVVINN